MAQRCRASSQIISVFCYKNVKKVKDCILMRNEMQCDARKSAGRGTTRPASSRFQPVRVADRRTNCNRQHCAAAGCFALDASAVVFLSYLFCTWKLGKVIIIFASQRFPAEGMIWGKLLGGFVVKCKEPREQPFRYGMLMMHSWARSVEEGLLINQESSDSPRTYRVSK